jgi:hypothetical protein
VRLLAENTADAAELIGRALRQACRNLAARLQGVLNGLRIALKNLSSTPLAARCGSYRGGADVLVPGMKAWPGPPRANTAALDGRTTIIQACDTRRLRNEVVLTLSRCAADCSREYQTMAKKSYSS